MLIGIEMSQNKPQPLMALFFSISVKSLLIGSNHLRRNAGRVIVILSLHTLSNDAPDRSRRHLGRAC
jgi:hypothetical protein